MNERIRRLVKQAGGHFSTRNLMSNPVQHRETIELWDDKIEKFAELLIRECISALDDADGSVHHGECLLEHFEIEELPACKHDWYSAKNPVVQNGSVCVICGAIDPREPEELNRDLPTYQN